MANDTLHVVPAIAQSTDQSFGYFWSRCLVIVCCQSSSDRLVYWILLLLDYAVSSTTPTQFLVSMTKLTDKRNRYIFWKTKSVNS